MNPRWSRIRVRTGPRDRSPRCGPVPPRWGGPKVRCTRSTTKPRIKMGRGDDGTREKRKTRKKIEEKNKRRPSASRLASGTRRSRWREKEETARHEERGGGQSRDESRVLAPAQGGGRPRRRVPPDARAILGDREPTSSGVPPTRPGMPLAPRRRARDPCLRAQSRDASAFVPGI